MVFKKRPAPRNKKEHRKPKKKHQRLEKDLTFSCRQSHQSLASMAPKMSERESLGLLPLTEDQIRTYVNVAYISRYAEPSEEDWPSIFTVLETEVPVSRKTLRSLFVSLQKGVIKTKRLGGTGPKAKLEADNPGLCAAALALNGGISPNVATNICNQTNHRLRPEYYEREKVCKNTMMNSLARNTDVQLQAILRRKTGNHGKGSEWANARVARVDMTNEMTELGKKLDKGEITMKDCKERDLPPLFKDACLITDQSHMEAVPAGGSGQSGSQCKKQYRLSVDPLTGQPKSVADGGVMPPRRVQLKPKFASQAQGCYTIACPVVDGKEKAQFLPTFDYTGTKMHSALRIDEIDKKKRNVYGRPKAAGGRHSTAKILTVRLSAMVILLFLKMHQSGKKNGLRPRHHGTKSCATMER